MEDQTWPFGELADYSYYERAQRHALASQPHCSYTYLKTQFTALQNFTLLAFNLRVPSLNVKHYS